MAFLHCRACDWEQDDFWERAKGGYLPLRPDAIQLLRNALFKKSVPWTNPETGQEREIVGTEFVARELEAIVKRIRGMKVLTAVRWNSAKIGWQCPRCGSDAWSTD